MSWQMVYMKMYYGGGVMKSTETWQELELVNIHEDGLSETKISTE